MTGNNANAGNSNNQQQQGGHASRSKKRGSPFQPKQGNDQRDQSKGSKRSQSRGNQKNQNQQQPKQQQQAKANNNNNQKPGRVDYRKRGQSLGPRNPAEQKAFAAMKNVPKPGAPMNQVQAFITKMGPDFAMFLDDLLKRQAATKNKVLVKLDKYQAFKLSTGVFLLGETWGKIEDAMDAKFAKEFPQTILKPDEEGAPIHYMLGTSKIVPADRRNNGDAKPFLKHNLNKQSEVDAMCKNSMLFERREKDPTDEQREAYTKLRKSIVVVAPDLQQVKPVSDNVSLFAKKPASDAKAQPKADPEVIKARKQLEEAKKKLEEAESKKTTEAPQAKAEPDPQPKREDKQKPKTVTVTEPKAEGGSGKKK